MSDTALTQKEQERFDRMLQLIFAYTGNEDYPRIALVRVEHQGKQRGAVCIIHEDMEGDRGYGIKPIALLMDDELFEELSEPE